MVATLPHGAILSRPRSIPEPRPGQLWSLSWDRTILGLVVLVRTYDSYFVGWPVTDRSLRPSSPCFAVAHPDSESELVCWPEAETGMSNALLDSFLGEVLTERQVRGIGEWVRRGDSVAGVEAYPHDDSDEALDALGLVCEIAAAWSDLDSADTQQAGVLNQATASAIDLDARAIGQILDISPGTAYEIASGRRILRPEHAALLAEARNVPVDDLWSVPSGPEYSLLRSPLVKADVLRKADQLRRSEEVIRWDAWERSLLAARQTAASSKKAVLERVRHAIESLE